MLKFNEELLQFVWKHKLLKPTSYTSVSGNEITLLKPGDLNSDAGPDFFNAQIRVNGIILAGNIEIHIKTSDWLRHRHQQNKSYDNIILHAVYEHDIDLAQNINNNVEVLELKDLITEETIERYHHIATAKDRLPCAGLLKNVSDLKFISWIERMTIERLEEKVKRINRIFDACGGDFTQTFYTLLLRNFGFKVNSLPFEMIAGQLPVNLILKYADDLSQLECLVLGIAGFLDEQFEDKYLQKIQNEFEFLKNKHKLTPLKKEIFKFSKLRPSNFPNVRLVQLAALIHSNPSIVSNPQNFTDFTVLKQTLQIELTGYWKHHYKLGGNAAGQTVSLGESSIENLIINTFAPFFFFYSRKSGKSNFSDLAIDFLSKCEFEINTKTKLFLAKRELLSSSAQSQGIINLYDIYCVSRQCLKCGIAVSVLNPVKQFRG